jgi:hypothetical protein
MQDNIFFQNWKKLLILIAVLYFCGLFNVQNEAFAGTWASKGGPSGQVAIAPNGYVYVSKYWYDDRIKRYCITVTYYNGSSWTDLPIIRSWSSSDIDYYIEDITVDNNNNLWVVVQSWDSEDDDGDYYVYLYSNGSWVIKFSRGSGNWGATIATAGDGSVLVSLDGSVYKYNGSTFQTLFYESYRGYLVPTADGSVWHIQGYFYPNGLLYYYKNGTVNSVASPATEYYSKGFVGNDGYFWLLTKGYLYRWNGSSWEQKGNYPNDVKEYDYVVMGPDGRIWHRSSTTGVIYCWNGQTATNQGSGTGELAIWKDGVIWSGGEKAYYPSGFSLVPSPNGATGQLVVKGQYDGSVIPYGTIQISTDGANFSDLFLQQINTYTLSVDRNAYWFRLKYLWVNNCNGAQQEIRYTNAFKVDTILSTLAVSYTTQVVQWDSARGRSGVLLSWSSMTNATGYKLHVFDGNAYRTKDLGNVTSWDSRTAKIFPHPGDLPENNSVSTDLFRWDGSGLDFEDTPQRLYRTTTGTYYDNYNNYWFRVTAYNQWMETDFNTPTAIVTSTLPNATDNQQPTGSINAVSREGLEKTYDTRIKVTVNVGDSLSGICRVELSNDGVSYTIKYEAPLNPDNGTGVANYANTFDWDVPLGAGTKVVYARITDAVGNQKVVTDTIALAEDMLPPSLTLTINGGAESTTSAIVTLTLSVQDNASTTSQMQMRFSNDGNLWSPWEPFAQTKMWDITASAYGGNTNPGIKKVYAQVCDQAQNVTLAVAEIGYNPNPPTGTVTIVGGSSGTWNGNAALFTSSDAPTLSLGFSGATYVRFDPGTGIWGDWEAYTSTKNVYLVKSSGVTRLRVQVKDAYGVASSPQEFLVVVDPTPPVIQSLRGLNGATATTSYSATLEISVKDNISGVLYYQYQVNEGYLSSWVPLSKNTIVVSGFSRGANRITVNVKDQAGNIASASTTIFKI